VDIIIPNQQESIDWWKALLAEPELVDRAVWVLGRGFDKPVPAIPLGKHRRSGNVYVTDEDLRGPTFERLLERPSEFPDLRYETRKGLRSRDVVIKDFREIAWGDDLTGLWNARDRVDGAIPAGAAEAHRALGRAFGYKEERIWALYPEGWPAVTAGHEFLQGQ